MFTYDGHINAALFITILSFDSALSMPSWDRVRYYHRNFHFKVSFAVFEYSFHVSDYEGAESWFVLFDIRAIKFTKKKKKT